MDRAKAQAPLWIAAIGGVVLWIVAAVLGGKREAWDSTVYWIGAYPVALAVCAYLGYRFPQRAWRWPLLLFEAQLLPLVLMSGGIGSLWLPGVLLLAVLALPGIALAQIAAKFSAARSRMADPR